MSKQLFERFARAAPTQIMHWFSSLPAERGQRVERSAMRSKINQAPMWIYREGTLPPERRLLLVAHCDTVFNDPPANISWLGNIAYVAASRWQRIGNNWRENGLGADDRAGCMMLWTFRNSGHSLLICNEEERGGGGAKAAVSVIPDLLAEHAFAIEIDRRGDQNYVFYDTSTRAFEDHLAYHLPEWNLMSGSWSDIGTICPAAGICGVNMAAGFLYEHTSDELFFLDAWMRTRAAIQRLAAVTNEKFDLPPKPSKGILNAYYYRRSEECEHKYMWISKASPKHYYCVECNSYIPCETEDAESDLDFFEESGKANRAALIRLQRES